VYLLLLSFVSDNSTAVEDKSISRDLVVELESLHGRSDCREDRKSVYLRQLE